MIKQEELHLYPKRLRYAQYDKKQQWGSLTNKRTNWQGVRGLPGVYQTGDAPWLSDEDIWLDCAVTAGYTPENVVDGTGTEPPYTELVELSPELYLDSPAREKWLVEGDSRVVRYEGMEVRAKPLWESSAKKVTYPRFLSRLSRGWDVGKALTLPLKHARRNIGESTAKALSALAEQGPLLASELAVCAGVSVRKTGIGMLKAHRYIRLTGVKRLPQWGIKPLTAREYEITEIGRELLESLNEPLKQHHDADEAKERH